MTVRRKQKIGTKVAQSGTSAPRERVSIGLLDPAPPTKRNYDWEGKTVEIPTGRFASPI